MHPVLNAFRVGIFGTVLLWASIGLGQSGVVIDNTSLRTSQVLIDFEGLPAMSYISGTPIPEEARLSDQFVSSVGVKFTSSGGYVAVVELGEGHAPSGVNGIGGSTPDGILTYSPEHPIEITFFNPSNPSELATTDFVSVRGDMWGSGRPIELRAYDAGGNLLASVTEIDSGGALLSISHPGIHSVKFYGRGEVPGGVALDDLLFNAETPNTFPQILSANVLNFFTDSDVTIQAHVLPGDEPISSVTLFYCVSGGTELSQSAIEESEYTWIANIGQYASGTEISWRITATDQVGNEALWPFSGGWLHFTVSEPGAIVAWGSNSNFQGQHTGQCNVPSPNEGFIAVSGGGYFSLGLRENGSIVAWGHNNNNQCIIPEPNEDFIAIAGGGEHALGLKSNGSIVAWGRNDYGQCNVPSPNQDFVAISAAGWQSLALRSDGSVLAWGRNDFGQCSVPHPNEGFIAIAAGQYHSLGIKSDGSVIAWGAGLHWGNWPHYGQCIVPEPNEGFVAIAGGDRHSLGVKSDGTVVAWGQNNYGQCNVPSPNEGFLEVSAGHWHSLGLKSDGSIVGWGRNNHGQCNVPVPNAGFISLSGGQDHGLALLGSMPVSIGDNPDPGDGPCTEVPRILAIGAVAPNPFNPRTTVWLDIPRAGSVTLAVHDLRGRLVRTLLSGQMSEGRHPVVWDGMDDRGAQAASGVYLVRLVTSDGQQRAVKVTLSK